MATSCMDGLISGSNCQQFCIAECITAGQSRGIGGRVVRSFSSRAPVKGMGVSDQGTFCVDISHTTFDKNNNNNNNRMNARVFVGVS